MTLSFARSRMFSTSFQFIQVGIIAALFFLISLPASAQETGESLGPPIGFYSFMNAGEHTVVIKSDATGEADFVLDRDTLEISWDVTWQDFDSEVTGVHIHAPGRPGEVAALALDLGPVAGGSSVSGSAPLPGGLLAHILTGRAYVNIHTRRNPEGEIRGKVERLHPVRGKIERPKN